MLNLQINHRTLKIVILQTERNIVLEEEGRALSLLIILINHLHYLFNLCLDLKNNIHMGLLLKDNMINMIIKDRGVEQDLQEIPIVLLLLII